MQRGAIGTRPDTAIWSASVAALTDEVLRELGLATAEIEDLRAKGVVG